MCTLTLQPLVGSQDFSKTLENVRICRNGGHFVSSGLENENIVNFKEDIESLRTLNFAEQQNNPENS